jgi:hypothetical protein
MKETAARATKVMRITANMLALRTAEKRSLAMPDFLSSLTECS